MLVKIYFGVVLLFFAILLVEWAKRTDNAPFWVVVVGALFWPLTSDDAHAGQQKGGVMTEKFYKVLAAGRKSCYGGDHVWEVGKWYEVQGELIPCRNGFHLCRGENLLDWIGEEIWEAQFEGEIIDNGDKIVVRKARITLQCAGWNERTARLFACDCAQDVVRLIPEPEAQECIEVARAYASQEASYEALASAREAAWESTRETAWDAAGAAAREAVWVTGRVTAWAAARDAAWASARAAAKAVARVEAGIASWNDTMEAAWAAARETSNIVGVSRAKVERKLIPAQT